MEFKLNLNAGAHHTVATDAVTLADARAFANRGRAAASSAASRVRNSSAAARARAAGAAAIANGRGSLEKLRAYKLKWHNWLYKNPGKTNFWLLITNVLYLALTLTILVLTFLVMHEHIDDFKRNEFTQHRKADGSQKQYPPCGMPTPDSMYLLQAIGALPAGGFDGATLEPDYKNWMQKVDRALCARIIPGATVPSYDDDMSVCEDPSKYVEYGTDHAEELLALGYLMDDDTIIPTLEDYQSQSDMDEKKAIFERRTCLVKKEDPDHPGEKPYYTEQQRLSYGDLKTRVARAYIAAMPAFSRYQKERDTCAEADGFKDPFDSFCKHSCHLRKELKVAASQQELLYTNADIPLGTTFTKQLYRLLALSLAGYYDRYHNNGECFRNKEVDANGDYLSAYDFCDNSMNPTTPGNDLTFSNENAVAEYSKQNSHVEGDRQCGSDAYSPPPPAPPIYRNDANGGVGTHKLSAQVCAAILQYGLFEQGRLFGIPDVIAPFVIDQRADRSIHFVSKWIYDAMYVNPMKKAGDILADPKSKLEMYIAYRLSSTSIWAILVANVAGYMMVRALAPTGVYILKLVGVTSNRPIAGEGPTTTFEPIKLVRPQLGWPVFLAMIVNLLAIYWILWLDPATQSHYYVTTSCDDWKGLGVQVPSGAFGTTWGKRRYARFGEHIIGILMFLTFFLVLFMAAIGRTFVDPVLVKQATKAGPGSTARLDKVALILIAFALAIQILFITQSIISGDAWYEAIKASDNDAEILETFSKDVIMSVWAAFWTSVSIGWYRQKWAVDNLKAVYQYAWMASCLVLLWMPVFQSAALLDKEIDTAFSDGKGTADTRRLIVYIFIYGVSAIWTAVVAIRLKAMYDAMPSSAAGRARTSAKLAEAKANERAYIEGAIAAAEEQRKRDAQAQEAFGPDGLTFAPASRPMFDLSGMRVPAATMPMRPQRKTDAVYMPLLPSQ